VNKKLHQDANVEQQHMNGLFEGTKCSFKWSNL